MQYWPNKRRGIKKYRLNIKCVVRVANHYPSNLFTSKHGVKWPHMFNQALM